MPQAAKRPCLKPGCPNLVDRGYCKDHEAGAKKEKYRYHGSSTSRGYDSRWQKVRLLALKRDSFLCVNCRDRYKRVTPAQSVHHRCKVTTHPHLRLSLDNLMSVCSPCHEELEKESI